MYFGGVEGGATHSNLVICNELGEVLSRSTGPGTNHWAIGIDGCAKIILDMLQQAKKSAGINADTPLESLGLTLSGCEQDSTNEELAMRVRELDINSSLNVYVASDSAGSLATGAPHGGLVIIAGTGSNSFLRFGDTTRNCGGWGHILGDEGGAYWIAHRAVKACFDDMDGILPSVFPVNQVWKLVKEHFNIDSRNDLLPYVYSDFKKPFFASMTKKLAILASSGDRLSEQIFNEAGRQLAAHASVLVQSVKSNSLRVVCVGSVWNSWGLLRKGFLDMLHERKIQTELELVRLKESSAVGAAWLAAKHINYNLPRDDTKICEIFYKYGPSHFQNGRHQNGGIKNGGVQNGKNGNRSENGGKEDSEIQNGGSENGVRLQKGEYVVVNGS